MKISRYKFLSGKEVDMSPFINKATKNNTLDFSYKISERGKRLDHYASEFLGSADNWWIIAAASGIGWWLQVPEGVVLKIPTDIEQVKTVIREIS